MLKNKGFKRAVAVTLLIAFYLVVWQGDVEMVKVLVWPTFTFAAAAMGLESYDEKIKTNTSSHTTDGDPSLRK
jgi:hypothetical protein